MQLEKTFQGVCKVENLHVLALHSKKKISDFGKFF